MKNFEDYAYYYNSFYREKDYSREARDVDMLLKIVDQSLNPANTCILDIGCGTGKHDYALCKLGYMIKGIDISENMITIAKQTFYDESERLSFDVGDFRTYRDTQKYDVIISMFHVMSYQTSNEDVLSAMITANENIKIGGCFLFDLWYGPGVMNDLPENRIKKVEDHSNQIIRYAYPVIHWNDNIVDVNYDVIIVDKSSHEASQIKETHRMRYFFRPEIENMLYQSGFEMIGCFDCKTLHETDKDSWTAYFLAKKTKET